MEDGGAAVVRVSSVYDTDPVGMLDQGNFLNLAAEIAWHGSPRDLLRLCQRVEMLSGRVRRERDGPRTLDIDVLLMGERVLRERGLEVPHPRLHERRFVLEPLCEIAPKALHPLLGLTIEQLLGRCADTSGVRPIPDRVWIERGGPPGYNPAAFRGHEE
jgi:2-amino-4-hydroxy-6-hydroxymethyldihydropteridine diphosphokinase